MASERRSLSWEKDIYSKGLQLNLWPYTEVISALYGEKSNWLASRKPKLLEIGCGAGNNLWGLSEAGFDCYGIDPSGSAIEFAEGRFRRLGIPGQFEVAAGQQIPFVDENFDYVLDRAAISHVPKDEIPAVIREAHRVLRPGGVFYSFGLFGEQHSDSKFGQLTTSGSLGHFTEGIFKGVGLTTFFTVDTIRGFFSDFQSLEITRSLVQRESGWQSEEFSLRCLKSPNP